MVLTAMFNALRYSQPFEHVMRHRNEMERSKRAPKENDTASNGRSKKLTSIFLSRCVSIVAKGMNFSPSVASTDSVQTWHTTQNIWKLCKLMTLSYRNGLCQDLIRIHTQTDISIYTIGACGDRWVLLLLLLLLMPFQPLVRYRCVCITAFRSRRTCACLLSQLLIFICAWVIRNRLKD